MTSSTRSASAASAVIDAELAAAREAGFGRQIGSLLAALRGSPVGKVLMLLAAAIVAVVLATGYGQVRLNLWNKNFFDALSRRDFSDFQLQLGVFVVIAGGLLILNVAQKWLVETLKLRLREGLVRDLVGHWMLPRRAFWLAHAGAMGVNPDQRMSDDAHNLCNLSADLAVGLLQASILFLSFAGILWVLSNDFSFRIGDADYGVPGFMLWAAMLYAGAGSLLSYWVGRSLIGRNSERYAREADLRFALVRINEHLDGISLAAGEADEKRRLDAHLDDVLGAMQRLVRGLTNLTWVTASFGWFTTVAPILVAAPLFFSGKISFGGLIAAAAAFTQAQSSLRWFVDNFSIIADWRATLLRVANFRQALVANHQQVDFASRIEYVQGEAGVLRIDDLQLESPAGRDRLLESAIELRRGDRVLIAAEPGTGKTLLFRGLAGLWPWGTGRIANPAGEAMAYMPRGTPYLPSGSLREVLAYPATTTVYDDVQYLGVLQRLGLERLLPQLDETRRWDRELSQDEQQSLAFARVLLQAPPWLIVDDALGSLDEDVLARVLDILRHELAQTGVVHIGASVQGSEAAFTRTLHLVKARGAPA